MKKPLTLLLLFSFFYSCSKKDSVSDENSQDTVIEIIEDSRSPQKNLDSDKDGVLDKLDCAPQDPSKKVLVSYKFKDLDGDGHRYPFKGEVCSDGELPKGYFNNNEEEIDCDDDDRTKWKGILYKFEDKDNDGFFTHNVEGKTFCPDDSGAVPSNISNYYEKTLDCNDDPRANGANEFFLTYGYEDKDGDQVGSGKLKSFCSNKNELPEGHSLEGGDCNEGNPLLWKTLSYGYVDHDGDGYTVAETGKMDSFDGDDFSIPGEEDMPFFICTDGKLPANLSTGPKKGTDCNDQDESLFGNNCN